MRLRDALRGWRDEERGEKARDPGATYHLAFSVPLLLAMLMAVQSLLQAAAR